MDLAVDFPALTRRGRKIGLLGSGPTAGNRLLQGLGQTMLAGRDRFARQGWARDRMPDFRNVSIPASWLQLPRQGWEAGRERFMPRRNVIVLGGRPLLSLPRRQRGMERFMPVRNVTILAGRVRIPRLPLDGGAVRTGPGLINVTTLGRRFGMGRRRENVARRMAITAAAAGMTGAGLMYLLDPVQGKRRRALVADKMVHLSKITVRNARATMADLTGRGRGLVAETASLLRREPVDDDILAARVRSEVGHVVEHPRVEIEAHDGHVVLSGYAAVAEAERLLKRVSKIRGVTEVENKLQIRPNMSA